MYLERFATALAETTSGRHRAPALTLLGLALLRGREPERAYQSLDTAVRADADFPAAAGALALLELDRGNLSRAHTLAVRDGIDPGLVEWIADEKARQSELRPAAGRNDPCPCGSGKKFKRCCANPLRHRPGRPRHDVRAGTVGRRRPGRCRRSDPPVPRRSVPRRCRCPRGRSR
ncbi:MAG TPA: hypothetical protein DCS55_10960 [Acidimicrobiaceae bacterium]|nr:hypothetical protein [Acidimicrobiaceae bacterium]